MGPESQKKNHNNTGRKQTQEARNIGVIFKFSEVLYDRKGAETACAENEQRFRALTEHASDGVVIYGSSGRIEYTSPATSRILGYSEGEILQSDPIQITHPDDLPNLLPMLNELQQTPGSTITTEYRMRHKDGSWRWIESNVSNFSKIAGIDGLVFNFRDITERKQAEETLRVSENRFRLATKATNDVIWEWNAKTHKLLWTENAQVVFGYLPEEVGPEEKWWDEHIHPDDRERIVSKMDSLIAGNESIWSEEYRFRRRDDSYAYISDRGYIERDASGEAIRMVGAMSDISERKQADKQVKLQLQRMSALSEIDRAISSSLDMRLSLDILLSEVLSQLDVDAASILLLNESNLTLEYLTGKGFRALSIRQSRIRLGEGHTGQVGLERKTLHIPNLLEAREQFGRADLLKHEEFRDYFGVPLVAKGMLKGVLEIFHRSSLDPDLEWVSYLETLCGQAAIAIDNAQLFEGMQKSNLELMAAYDATIVGWSHAMDLRDKETEDHTQRVTELTLKIAEKMGISQQKQVQIRRGALLHDIGKLGVPDQILLKRGKLSEEELAIMRQHPAHAFEMLSSIAYLRPALDIPYCHHEKWDGSGYPRGLKGEQIPLAARIFAVVDVWDALTSDRPYRPAWTKDKTLAFIKEQSGRHFDPGVVDVFLELISYSGAKPA